MSSHIRQARLVLPAVLMMVVALLIGALMLTGCGVEETEKPPMEITVDEVPIIHEGEEEEPAADDAVEEADEGQSAEDAEEVPAAPDAESELATGEQPLPEDSAEDEQPGLLSRTGGVLKGIGGFLGKLVFVLILPAAVAGTLVGMPGGLLVLADAVAFSAFHGWAVPPWWLLLILLAIAGIAEAAESLLSFVGVKHGGASNKTGVWVMVGGFTGAVLGGLFAPLLAGIGVLAGPAGWVLLSIIPPIGLGMLGGFLGGYFYEVKHGKDPREARRSGWAALMGRLAGSFAKAMLVGVMAAIVLISTWGALF